MIYIPYVYVFLSLTAHKSKPLEIINQTRNIKLYSLCVVHVHVQ
jgi:hypothetical protein